MLTTQEHFLINYNLGLNRNVYFERAYKISRKSMNMLLAIQATSLKQGEACDLTSKYPLF